MKNILPSVTSADHALRLVGQLKRDDVAVRLAEIMEPTTPSPTFSCDKDLFVPCLDCAAAGKINHEAHKQCCKDRTTEDYPNAYDVVVAAPAINHNTVEGLTVLVKTMSVREMKKNKTFLEKCATTCADTIADPEAAPADWAKPRWLATRQSVLANYRDLIAVYDNELAVRVTATASTRSLKGSKSCEVVGDLFAAADQFAGSVHFPYEIPAHVAQSPFTGVPLSTLLAMSADAGCAEFGGFGPSKEDIDDAMIEEQYEDWKAEKPEQLADALSLGLDALRSGVFGDLDKITAQEYGNAILASSAWEKLGIPVKAIVARAVYVFSRCDNVMHVQSERSFIRRGRLETYQVKWHQGANVVTCNCEAGCGTIHGRGRKDCYHAVMFIQEYGEEIEQVYGRLPRTIEELTPQERAAIPTATAERIAGIDVSAEQRKADFD